MEKIGDTSWKFFENISNLIYGINGVSKIIVETQARKFNFTQVFSWHIRHHREARQTNTHSRSNLTLQFVKFCLSKQEITVKRALSIENNGFWKEFTTNVLTFTRGRQNSNSEVLDNNRTAARVVQTCAIHSTCVKLLPVSRPRGQPSRYHKVPNIRKTGSSHGTLTGNGLKNGLVW